MKAHLAPALKKRFGDHYLLWFMASNTYNIIDCKFNTWLDVYFKSNTETTFLNTLIKDNVTRPQLVLNSISQFLNDCNTKTSIPNYNSYVAPKKQTPLKHWISINNTSFLLEFDSDIVKKTIFPALEHLQHNTPVDTYTHYRFFLYESHLYMVDGKGTVLIKTPKLDYHILQGKFIFKLLCDIHNIENDNWIGTLHGCTITDNKSSIFITGVSGKGKSTFSTLLACHGLHVLADDISALSANNHNFYYNPSAVSIKSGAFSTLRPLISNFKELSTVEFNANKGPIKYVPFEAPSKLNYASKAIILIHFKAESKTLLKQAELPEVLEAFIADSWISPKLKHAKGFMQWLQSQQFYSLTYSNTAEAVDCVKQLF